MNQMERESREALYAISRTRRTDRALEVSVMAAAGLVIVIVALSLWLRP